MDIQVLLRDLQRILDEATVYFDGGDKDEAREQLRPAKQLLDDEFAED